MTYAVDAKFVHKPTKITIRHSCFIEAPDLTAAKARVETAICRQYGVKNVGKIAWVIHEKQAS